MQRNKKSSLSVITLKENEIETSKKGKMFSKNMIQSYAIYRDSPYIQKVSKGWKFRDMKKYSMQTLIKTQVDCLY